MADSLASLSIVAVKRLPTLTNTITKQLTMIDTPEDYYFTHQQISFLMQFVRNNAQYEDGEDREWMEDLANQIEDQIVNHPANN